LAAASAQALAPDSIESKIEKRFHLTVLGEGHVIPMGTTIQWNEAELQLIFEGLENLEQAVGQKNSHLWNAGGIIAKAGSKTVGGQFGAVHPWAPNIINVVIDVKKERFSATKIAQRIAHESAHIWDLQTARDGLQYWSAGPQVKIFEFCKLPPGHAQSLYTCYQKSPAWFNFHPTAFAAKNSGEFYGKMIEEWVREKQGIVASGNYRKQNAITAALWNEMIATYKLK
jgi:hypothetical protein